MFCSTWATSILKQQSLCTPISCIQRFLRNSTFVRCIHGVSCNRSTRLRVPTMTTTSISCLCSPGTCTCTKSLYPTLHHFHSSFRFLSLTTRNAATSCSRAIMARERPSRSSMSSKNSIFPVQEPFHDNSGFVAHAHEMTLQSGNDAHASFRSLYRQCVAMAPSVLLVDPLYQIAAENSIKKMNRSDGDQAIISEFMHILQDAKLSGVTVVGVTRSEDLVLPRVIRAFDETVEFFTPSQRDRVRFFQLFIERSVSDEVDIASFSEQLGFLSYLLQSFHSSVLRSPGMISQPVCNQAFAIVLTSNKGRAAPVCFSASECMFPTTLVVKGSSIVPLIVLSLTISFLPSEEMPT